jgi:hypothetical protein
MVQPVPQPQPQPQSSTPQPAPAAAPAPSPDGFASLFAGFTAPAEEQQRPTVAVDLAAVQAANERAAAEKAAIEARQAAQAKKLADARKAAADRKAAAEKKLADAKKAEEARKAKEEARRLAANPARTWVQVLTGGNRAKMGKEWAGLQAKAPELRGRKAYVTPWNRVYRLVTGPFPSDAAAQEFVAKLKARAWAPSSSTARRARRWTALRRSRGQAGQATESPLLFGGGVGGGAKSCARPRTTPTPPLKRREQDASLSTGFALACRVLPKAGLTVDCRRQFPPRWIEGKPRLPATALAFSPAWAPCEGA